MEILRDAEYFPQDQATPAEQHNLLLTMKLLGLGELTAIGSCQ